MNKIRSIINIMEATSSSYQTGNPDVTYTDVETKGQITKVIATLKSDTSGKYTKLGRNLNRIKWLSEKIDQLKEEVKADTKTQIADLFHADDACRTRVVDTVSFTFELTKDPKPTNTVQYSKVLEALQEHLTPELIEVLEGLKNQFSTTTQKSPALKATDKRYQNESVDLTEGLWDKLTAYAAKFYDFVKSWGARYDAELDRLKSMVNLGESTHQIDESDETDISIDTIQKLISSGRLALSCSVEKEYGSYGSGQGVKGYAKLYFDDQIIAREDDFTSVASLDSSYNDLDY